MAKKILTPEEVKEIIKLETGAPASEVAEGVFRKLFEDEKKRLEKAIDDKVSPIIWGGLIATALVLISIFGTSFWFMADYDKHYLDTKTATLNDTAALREENRDLQEKLNDRMDYIERLLLQKGVK